MELAAYTTPASNPVFMDNAGFGCWVCLPLPRGSGGREGLASVQRVVMHALLLCTRVKATISPRTLCMIITCTHALLHAHVPHAFVQHTHTVVCNGNQHT